MAHQILLCDDELHIIRAAEFKFKRAGYEVRCAHDGQEAWEAIQQQKPDLLVTDCQMPRMSGLELAAKIAADPQLADLPVVMLTAKGYELGQEEVAEQFGVRAILAKPFSPREMLKLAESILAEAKQNVEAEA